MCFYLFAKNDTLNLYIIIKTMIKIVHQELQPFLHPNQYPGSVLHFKFVFSCYWSAVSNLEHFNGRISLATSSDNKYQRWAKYFRSLFSKWTSTTYVSLQIYKVSNYDLLLCLYFIAKYVTVQIC